jgi:hypothetical protein
MTRVIRSRRAGLSRDEVRQQPLYARMLGLQYLAPSGFLCFVFLEGAVALGILLALAELVSWWGVLVLPITVAGMVKLNDVVAGMLAYPTAPTGDVSLTGARTVDLRGSLTVPAPDVHRPQEPDRLDHRQQWARQTATRRYE